jgi:hypothetical protein
MALTQVQGQMIAPSTTLTTPIVATTMGVGGATPSGSGAGISFPATQSASSDANTLDDYEEGTWTPGQGSDLTVVGTFSSSGNYVKIGRLVIIRGQLNSTTSISFGGTNARITAVGQVPFPISSSSDPAVGCLTNASNSVGSFCWISGTYVYATTAIAATANIFFQISYYTST